ncbi:hypothetical protein QFC20_006788 [Naganishia adeliensis]|uniref:Uncharacterized protein n=1 Tax=Naganishia adeliensis TaxID=92952 RepID=A0ACC2V8I1_9TREE|nr:hypothetical protein QFC20_006788 [Naganishia adeliensis]
MNYVSVDETQEIHRRRLSSSPAQPEDQASDADMPWSQRDTPFADFFWSHWSPIEHSLAEIDQLMSEGSSEYKTDSSSENEMEYQRWHVEYENRTGGRFNDAPDWMAQELSSWLFDHPDESIPGLLERFGKLEDIIQELRQGGHMPALYGRLDKEKFNEQWPALRRRVKVLKGALKQRDPKKFDFPSDTESAGEETDNDGGSNAAGGLPSPAALTDLSDAQAEGSIVDLQKPGDATAQEVTALALRPFRARVTPDSRPDDE